MQTTSIKMVSAIGECDCDSEADAPGRDGEELGVDRCIT